MPASTWYNSFDGLRLLERGWVWIVGEETVELLQGPTQLIPALIHFCALYLIRSGARLDLRNVEAL